MPIYKTNTPFHRLDLAQLKHFFVVASFGGFSKASRATGISQPALSLGLKKLEKSLGTTLIQRRAKTFALTHEGLSLFTLCQRFEASLDSTLRSFPTAELETRRTLRIGTALSIGFGPLIPFCLNNAKARHPMEIEMTAQTSFQLLDDLIGGVFDAALVPDHIYDGRLSFHKLWKDRIVFIVSAKDESVFDSGNWKRLLGTLPLIHYRRETPMRAIVDKICAEHGLEFRTTYSVNSLDALKLLVSRQIGGAFVLRSLVTDELEKGSFVAIKLPIHFPETGLSLATQRGEHGDSIAKLIKAALMAR